MLQYTMYIKIYIHLDVSFSLGTHNFDSMYATKFEFNMILNQTDTVDFMADLSLSEAGSQNL